MKRKPSKKERSLKSIEKELWSLCKAIIRKKYKHECYTCGAKRLRGRNLQTGHLWPKMFLDPYLKYEILILRNQCTRCNIWGGGNGAEFYRRMVEEHGQDSMDILHYMKDTHVLPSFIRQFYLDLIEKYKVYLKELPTKKQH